MEEDSTKAGANRGSDPGSPAGKSRGRRRPPTLDEHISASSQLAQLREQARDLARATARMRRALDPLLGERLSVARLDDREMVIVADGAAWATHARFVAPAIAEALRPDLSPSARPRVRVLVTPPKPTRETRGRPRPSAKAAEAIEAAAGQFEGSPLGEALARLAASTRR